MLLNKLLVLAGMRNKRTREVLRRIMGQNVVISKGARADWLGPPVGCATDTVQ